MSYVLGPVSRAGGRSLESPRLRFFLGRAQNKANTGQRGKRRRSLINFLREINLVLVASDSPRAESSLLDTMFDILILGVLVFV